MTTPDHGGRGDADDAARLEELIGRSSLGATGARQLRARVPLAEARRITRLAARAGESRVLLAWNVLGERDARPDAFMLVGEAVYAVCGASVRSMPPPRVWRQADDGGLVLVAGAARDAPVALIVEAVVTSLRRYNESRRPAGRLRLRLAFTTVASGQWADDAMWWRRIDEESLARVGWLFGEIGWLLGGREVDFAAAADAGLGLHVRQLAGRGQLLRPGGGEPGGGVRPWVYLPPPPDPSGPRSPAAARVSAAGLTMTPGEAAVMLRVDPKTVTRWARAGKLTVIRTPGGHRRYREDEVRALLAGSGGAASASAPGQAGSGASSRAPGPRTRRRGGLGRGSDAVPRPGGRDGGQAASLAVPAADATGPGLKPDPGSARTAGELAAALRQFRAWSGDPSLHQIAQRAGGRTPRSTIWDALNRPRHVPRLEVVLAIVAGCGGTEEDQSRFAAAWRAIRLAGDGEVAAHVPDVDAGPG